MTTTHAGCRPVPDGRRYTAANADEIHDDMRACPHITRRTLAMTVFGRIHYADCRICQELARG